MFRLSFLTLFLIGFSCTPVDLVKHKSSIALINVTTLDPDFEAPWLMLPPKQNAAFGFFLDKSTLLTTYKFVKNSKLVEVQFVGESEKLEADVLFFDPDAGYAIIKLKNPVKGVSPYSMSKGELSIGKKCKGIRVEKGDQIKEVELTLEKVEMGEISTSLRRIPQYVFSGESDGFGLNQPLLCGGMLAGLIVSKGDDEVTVTPSFLLSDFLSRQKKEEYAGYASFGVSTDAVLDKNRLEYLGIDPDQTGLAARYVLPDSAAAEHLQIGDFITAIDGNKLDEYGYVEHEKWGKIKFHYLIALKHPGEKIKVTRFREGKKETVSWTLDRFDSNTGLLHVNSKIDVQLDHEIIGGLVFQELTLGYLKSWGKNWYKRAPLRLMEIFSESNFDRERKGERVVVLNKVLADAVNEGYQELQSLVVEKVNDREIRSLAELREIIQKHPLVVAKKKYAKFQFKYREGMAVFDYEAIASSKARIASKYL